MGVGNLNFRHFRLMDGEIGRKWMTGSTGTLGGWMG